MYIIGIRKRLKLKGRLRRWMFLLNETCTFYRCADVFLKDFSVCFDEIVNYFCEWKLSQKVTTIIRIAMGVISWRTLKGGRGVRVTVNLLICWGRTECEQVVESKEEKVWLDICTHHRLMIGRFAIWMKSFSRGDHGSHRVQALLYIHMRECTVMVYAEFVLQDYTVTVQTTPGVNYTRIPDCTLHSKDINTLGRRLWYVGVRSQSTICDCSDAGLLCTFSDIPAAAARIPQLSSSCQGVR